MKDSNVLNLDFHRSARIAGELVAQIDEAIGELLEAATDEQTRQKLSQALIHLHEAKLLLS